MTVLRVGETLSGDDGLKPDVRLGPGWGWSEHRVAEGTSVSLKGYLHVGCRTLEGDAAARHVASVFGRLDNVEKLPAAAQKLAGHFAVVVRSTDATLAVVDRIRSIPLFYAVTRAGIKIDDQATRLRDACSFGPGQLDIGQVQAAALSGYTIGAATIYAGLQSLRPGEALLIDRHAHRVLRWFVYDAWNTQSNPRAEETLSQLNRSVLERLVGSASDRAICVPLSAGYDSRLIAAGLKEVGAKNVRLFSYGSAGNHDAETAKKIADRLGYPWQFVPFSTRSQRRVFDDPEHDRLLWGEADSCTSAPFEQDWGAIVALRNSGYIPRDALLVNGQTGDFISGNHAPVQLIDTDALESPQDRRDRVLSAYIAKHYRLWEALVSPECDARISDLLRSESEAAGATFADNEALHGIHEMLEYQDRQSKYVVGGQRTYEALGLGWRLPLWDDDYIEFWRRLPGSFKAGQQLYRRVLERDNWGGVFSGIPINRKTIRPRWIIPLRLAAKVAHLPFGAERWHRFERRVFQWWMDPLRVSVVVPYHRAALDGRGARHGLAWITERWLARHGVDFAKLFEE